MYNTVNYKQSLMFLIFEFELQKPKRPAFNFSHVSYLSRSIFPFFWGGVGFFPLSQFLAIKKRSKWKEKTPL